jgi:putative transposase
VVVKAIAAHGVPQRLLSDNGIALNPSWRGYVGQLVSHLGALGVEAITGKPYKPTTQGKNERFHQTLFRYLDKQPIAESLAELQAQVDAFDDIYNTERPHHGLPGRITPRTAWEATPKAPTPRPKPDPPSFAHAVVKPHRPAPAPADLPNGTSVKTLNTAGAFVVAGVTYKVDGRRGLEQVLVVIDGDKITAADLDGESSSNTPGPHPESPTSATDDPAAHAQRPGNRHRSPDTPTVTNVLIPNCHRCPETSHDFVSPILYNRMYVRWFVSGGGGAAIGR